MDDLNLKNYRLNHPAYVTSHQVTITRIVWPPQCHDILLSTPSKMAHPLPAGLTPAEVSFLCEMEMVTVVPRSRLDGIELLSVRLSSCFSPRLSWKISSGVLYIQLTDSTTKTGHHSLPQTTTPRPAAPLARPPPQEAAPRQHRPARLAAPGLPGRHHPPRDPRRTHRLQQAATAPRPRRRPRPRPPI